jgi:TusA-related sulfurtransferase
MKTLDCRAQKCPQPVVETRKFLLAEPGIPLTVLVGDEISSFDGQIFCRCKV